MPLKAALSAAYNRQDSNQNEKTTSVKKNRARKDFGDFLDLDIDDAEGIRIVEEKWRRRRDSNSRKAFTFAGFQDQCIQPLCHPSAARRKYYYKTANSQIANFLYAHFYTNQP